MAFGLQYGHGIGLSIWERSIFSGMISLDHPEVLEEGMVFALETYWPAMDGWSAARIEERSSLRRPAVRSSRSSRPGNCSWRGSATSVPAGRSTGCECRSRTSTRPRVVAKGRRSSRPERVTFAVLTYL